MLLPVLDISEWLGEAWKVLSLSAFGAWLFYLFFIYDDETRRKPPKRSAGGPTSPKRKPAVPQESRRPKAPAAGE